MSALERQRLSGHVPGATAAVTPVGRAPADQRLSLAIALPLRNQESLNNLLADLYDPASPRYHQYLTPEQFTASFGPTETDYEAVAAFARANNLQITARHPNRVLLDVSGTVADIEKAFQISLQLYAHPSEGRNFFAPDREPSVDLSVPLLHITGLDNFQLPRPASLHRVADRVADRVPTDSGTGGGTPQAGGSGPNNTYRGNDFRHAYGPGVSLNGSGQMLALLEFDYYYPADIATYRSQTGIASVPLIDVFLDGAPAVAGNNNIEVALDIEVANAMAPGLSAIIIYDGAGGIGNEIMNRMAKDNMTKQISASWTYS
jgi:subtilase family serine protease